MKQRKQKHTKSHSLHTYSSNTLLLFSLLSALFIGFLFISPYFRGLFNGGSFQFEGPIFGSFLWGSLVLFLFSIYIWKVWQFENERSPFAMLIWLIPLSYLLSIVSAASKTAAWNSVWIHLFIAIVFICGIYLAKQRIGLHLLLWGILGSGYAIVIFGLMNLFGDASFFGLINYSDIPSVVSDTYKDAVRMESRGLRLTSVFQYANTYAAYLTALLFASLVLLISSRNWIVMMISSLMLVPITVSLILTMSRGGLALLPVILVILLPFLQLSKQILLGVHATITLSAALLIWKPINTIGLTQLESFSSTLYIKGWIILIVASLVVAGLSVLIQKFIANRMMQRIESRIPFRGSHLMLPLIMALIGSIGVIVLYQNDGLSSLQQHSVLERATFYNNAIEIIKDYPIIGTGGGGWSALYQKYQTNPYTSSQAHNFYLQYWIEVGFVGWLILILLLALIFYLYIRNHFKNKPEHADVKLIFFIIATAILIHSAIDFNMSYVYIGMLVFLSLGVLSSDLKLPDNIQSGIVSLKAIRYFPAVLIIISIVMFFASLRMLQADNQFELALQRLQDNKPYHEIMEPMNRAIQTRVHPDYMNYKISLLRQVYQQTNDEQYRMEAFQAIEQLKTSEPYNRQVIDHEYALYVENEDYIKALEVVEKAIDLFPWDIALYERAIVLNFELGRIHASDPTYWDHALTWAEIIEIKSQELELLNPEQQQGREFNISADIQSLIDHIKQIRES